MAQRVWDQDKTADADCKKGMVSNMTEQEKKIIARASVPMTFINVLRWIFMFVALVVVLFLFFGNKVWLGTAWYDNLTVKIYSFLLWDVALMLFCSILRIAFTARYNRIVRNL